MSPENIDRVIELLEKNPSAGMATLATRMPSPEQLANPACVKVVFDDNGRAMYFSRSPIPFVRDAPTGWLGANASEPPVSSGSGGSPSARPQPPFNDPPLFFQHLGIYAYRRDTLLKIAAMQPSSLEMAEKLEQLRMLQIGGPILVAVVDHAASGIDTPADYAAFVARHRAAA